MCILSTLWHCTVTPWAAKSDLVLETLFPPTGHLSDSWGPRHAVITRGQLQGL